MHSRRQLARAAVQRDADREPATGDATIDLVADLRLEHLHFPRQIHRHLALLAIDRTELDRDFETILGTISPPISGHRFHPRKVWKKPRFSANKFGIGAG